ncbi:MAG: hypothetical protein JW971_02300 [Synergistales bacterium]|nr:hypothetical protein [Synergistales bacterium]
MSGKLILLSGPSCVGKGPLTRKLTLFFPEICTEWRHLTLFNSRSPRPGEVEGRDYHFRSRDEIDRLRKDPEFRVFEVRADLQALYLQDVRKNLAEGDLYFEGNPFVGSYLLDIAVKENIESLNVFLSPLSMKELRFLKSQSPSLDLPSLIADVMRRKLLRRTLLQKGIISLPDLEDVEKRAGSAYMEMKEAWKFQAVIPNHDGEDSENWNAFYYPIGDAWRAMISFRDFLLGKGGPEIEKWERDLLP